MAKHINQLSARFVSTVKEPGLYGDGNSLYLKVTNEQARSWIFRFMIGGRARSMGLGSAVLVSLADARDLALDLRRQVQRGVDPLEARREQDERACLEVASAKTFRDCAEAYIAAHRAGWSNAKHAAQWTNTLTTYAFPEIGDSPIQKVDTSSVMRILDPIWSSKAETANRVRNRIECVLSWASARNLRTGENPARWRGHLDQLLPPRSKVRQVEHHPALPYAEVPEFMSRLRKRRALSALALDLCILTALRTGEIIGAEWSEIDLEKGLWSVPAARMKARKPHRVPLSGDAVQVLRHLEKAKQSRFIFSGDKPNRHMSNMAMLNLLERMGHDDVTVHGFRSTFRDWAAEKTEFPNELVEMALAHTIENRAEAAYRRGDMFERRQKLMEEWAEYCRPEITTEWVGLSATNSYQEEWKSDVPCVDFEEVE